MAALKDIKYILFGVQFNRSFKLLDSWGAIADDILYKSNYFDSDFFPNISTQYTTERSLSNPVTGNFFVLSSNNLVFKYYLPKNSDFQKEYDYFMERINKYFVDKILTKNNLVIKRLGVVFACELSKKELESFSKKYFKDDIEGITDFRFAKKGPAKTGQMWRGVDDYINKIYSVGKIDSEDECKGITYDFQLHFNPLMPDIRIQTPGFLKEALNSFKKDIIEVEKNNG